MSHGSAEAGAVPASQGSRRRARDAGGGAGETEAERRLQDRARLGAPMGALVGLVFGVYPLFDFFSGQFYGTVSVLGFTDFLLFSCTFYAAFSAEF